MVGDALQRPLTADDTRVLALFGISHARATELAGTLRHLRGLRKSQAQGKTLSAHQIDTDINIQSLVGDVEEVIVTATLRLVSRLLPAADRKKVFIFDAGHGHNMPPTGTPAESAAERAVFTDSYAGKHVEPTTDWLIVPTNPRHHWTLNVINNVSNTICTLEPLSDDRAATNRRFQKRLEQLLKVERARLGHLARPTKYVEIPKPANLSTQTDGTSCGPFCFGYTYFDYVHGRLPTNDDFRGKHQLALRLVMLDACLTGSVKRGALPGAAAAAAGGAAGGGAGGGAQASIRGRAAPSLAADTSDTSDGSDVELVDDNDASDNISYRVVRDPYFGARNHRDPNAYEDHVCNVCGDGTWASPYRGALLPCATCGDPAHTGCAVGTPWCSCASLLRFRNGWA